MFNILFRYVLVGVFLFLLIPFSAQAWENDNDAVDIRVVDDRGHPLNQYPLRDSGSRAYRAYLEANRGQSYAIKVRNRTRQRLGIVIAVDGRNIISGDPSQLTPNERMYLLEPYQEATYSGWRTGKDQVNRFYFTDAEDSYAGAWDDYTAMGVISAAVYREARPSYYQPQNPPYYWNKKGSNQEKRSLPSNPGFFSEPGTGFGDEEWSPTRRVEFEPQREAMARYVFKYEWQETLCQRGIADCRPSGRGYWGHRYDRGYDKGYAPYPPSYHRNHNRWDR
jgi:hypothetical protein